MDEVKKDDAKTCYIVGGGPSLKGFDFGRLRRKTTICVNRAIFNVFSPNYFITVDYTFFGGLYKYEQNFLLRSNMSKIFVADFSTGDLVNENGVIKDVRHKITYKLKMYGINEIIIAKRDSGIGYTSDSFCAGRNSGYCAFQLAILLGFTKIYLLGIDLTCSATATHYHNHYRHVSSRFKDKLQTYFEYFKIGLEQVKREHPEIEIYSCSSTSRLNTLVEYSKLESI